jgi:hypothetical protein
MADNVAITAGSGTSVAADEIGGVYYQRVKITWGADGAAVDASAADPLPVAVIAGQVTVAAGSGLNGATVQRVTVATDDTVATDLTAIKTAVQIMDDWDESDRVKSNPIVGQAGVAAGSGTNGATVQRVTVATDDTVATDLTAIKTAAQIIDDWDESDRAKVNPIVGQAGVAGGNGPVSALTQRVAIADWSAGEYETVAASQTGQALGATGATGDFISGILVVPATTSPGNVLLLDNATSITVFTGGASSVTNLVPFFIPLGLISVSGAWKITTGANVSCIGIGNFT